MPARLLTLAVALIVSLAAAELALRTVVQPEGGTANGEAAAGAPDGLPVLTHILEIAAPNRRGMYRGVLHETNSLGLRERELQRSKPAGVFRIVVFGDSFVMGEGVGVDARYTTRVEHALNGSPDCGVPVGGRSVEVVNAGLSGLSLAHALERLESVGMRYEPDLLIYGFTINDLEVPGYERFVEPSRSARRIAPPHPSRLVELVRTRFTGLRELVHPPRESYLHELDHNYFDNPAVFSEFEANLDRYVAIAKREGLCAVMFLHTHLFHLHRFHPFLRHYDAAAEAARRRGIRVIESFERFRGLRESQLWLDERDSHPNARGHELLAAALVDGLSALPRDCFSPAKLP